MPSLHRITRILHVLTNYRMKLLMLIPLLALSGLTMFSGPQDFDYKKAWKEVETAIDKGLPKTALKKVKEIYTMAQKEDNNVQVIKSTLYQTRLVLETEELGLENVITDLEVAIDESSDPTKSILQSYAAEIMASYLSNQYYTLSQRTDLGAAKPKDIRTWSPNNYRDYISDMYLASVEGRGILTVKTEGIKDLLQDTKGVDYELRPTLYDLLTDRALRYFATRGMEGMKPSFSFALDKDEFLAEADVFRQLSLNTEDTNSRLYRVVRLYQEALNKNVDNTRVYIDYDLKRIAFVRRQGNVPNAEEVALKTLMASAGKYEKDGYRASYLLEAASILRSDNKSAEALKIYQEVKKSDADKNQKAAAQNAINGILQKRLSLQAETVYTSDENPIFNITYRNLDKAYLKLVRLKGEEYKRILRNNRRDKPYEILEKAEKIRDWSCDLVDKKDYREASIETETADLPYGTYAVVMSDDKSFSTSNHAYAYAVFTVSDLAYVTQRFAGKEKIIVVDRESGKPVSGAIVNVYRNYYNNVTRKNDRSFDKAYTTDKDGKVWVTGSTDTGYTFTVTKGKDNLNLNSNLYMSRDNDNRRVRLVTEFFTDRGIYRPGQVVHYKILATQYSRENIPQVLAQYKREVTLYDANGQEVSKTKHTLNEYGTASGTFTIPTGLIGGQFRLSTEGGSHSIRVEEYKRPKLKVEMDPFKGLVAIGDEVTVKGSAKSFAGAPASNALFTYTVIRKEYTTWWDCYRGYAQNEVLMSSGKGRTDASGAFEVIFPAKGEKNDKESKTYTYEVTVNVTDAGGETQTATKTISVSAQPYGIEINLKEIVTKDDLKKVVIKTLNLDGQPVDAKLKLTLVELISPKAWKKERYWGNTDQRLRSGYPVERNGRLDAYKTSKIVKTETITLKDGKLEIDLSKGLKKGAYEVRIESVDHTSESKKVTYDTRFAILDMDKCVFPPLELLYVSGLEKQAKVGEKLNIKLGTSDPKLVVYYYLVRGKVVVKEGIATLDDMKKIEYTPSVLDKGGLKLHLHYTKHNRSYVKDYTIDVPWYDKQLEVELITMRDKVLPGSKEEWIVSIKNKNGGAVDAELLAAMYDASLDDFESINYNKWLYPNRYSNFYTSLHGFGTGLSGMADYAWNNVKYIEVNGKRIPVLQGVDYYIYGNRRYYSYGMNEAQSEGRKMYKTSAPMRMESADMVSGSDVIVPDGALDFEEEIEVEKATSNTDKRVEKKSFSPRENLNETVFFFPHIKSKDGKATFSFTMNEAMTRWKFLAFAHDKELRYGSMEHELVTQKDIMIVPNAPRFTREGDRFVFPATVTNFTTEDKEVTVELDLKNIHQLVSANHFMGSGSTKKTITVPAGTSQRVEWELSVPSAYKSSIQYTVTAKSGDHTDGEVGLLPVLTNQKLILDTKLVDLAANSSATIDLAGLISNSETAQPHALTIEYTANPIWYAIQAMPYVQEQSLESTLGTAMRYYTNSLAAHIVNTNPRIKEVFDTWKLEDIDALLSNLEKNEELKYTILQETPWVRDAQSETEQKRRIALLFDANKLNQELSNGIAKLVARQKPDGGFSWFSGGRSNWYTTMSIVENLGKLRKMGALKHEKEASRIVRNAITFLREEMEETYNRIDKDQRAKDHLFYREISYLYIYTLWPEFKPTEGATSDVYAYYLGQAEKYWLKKGLYSEALLGLVMLDSGNDRVAKAIAKSLDERSFYSDDLGRYWNTGNSYHWHQLPIGSHARLIEFFNARKGYDKLVEDAKKWLVKQKRTNHWKTPKATVDALYALLINGENNGMISSVNSVATPQISMDGKPMDFDNVEAGTGYVKKTFSAEELKGIKSITFDNKADHLSWGAVYYQYFENLDKIKSVANTPLKLDKKLYKKIMTDSGPSLVELNDGDKLTIGDEVVSRISIKVDRDMNYVHLKDMRPSGLEPIRTKSGYTWSGGLGYYENPRDVANNYFIDYLGKGTYVLENTMRVVHAGTYSGGVATLQSMYAPEFTAHSEGVRVEAGSSF